MRFRHLDPAVVIEFLRNNPSIILVREWDRERAAGGIAGMLRISRPQAAKGAQPGKISDVEFMAGRHAPSDIGAVFRFFFHINSSSEQFNLPLIEAVAHVESRGLSGEFLLAGHPDGGLVSVSRERLPFQSGDPITWWGP